MPDQREEVPSAGNVQLRFGRNLLYDELFVFNIDVINDVYSPPGVECQKAKTERLLFDGEWSTAKRREDAASEKPY